MRFVRLTADAYATFMSTVERQFVPQMPEYGLARQTDGHEVEYVGVVDGPSEGPDGSEKVIGAGLLLFQPWKKFFQRGLMNYGPTLDWENKELVDFFFTELTSFLRKNHPKVLSVRICPLVPKNFYEDIQVVEKSRLGEDIDIQFRQLGMTRIHKEFYEQPDIQIRYIYTKNIAGMSFEEATATLSKGLRRRFHNEGRYGVEVRFLPPEEFDVFEQLHESTAERTKMAGITSSSENLYRNLMTELGPERAFLSVAYLSPVRYLEQIRAEREELKERLTVLEARKPTKARDREIDQVNKRFPLLDEQEATAQKTLDEHGDNIPFNSALSFVAGKEIILLLGGMDKRFNSYGRDYPVERAMFKLACDMGLEVYNTFGVSGVFDETAVDAPVLAFKRWLGGDVEEFIGTYVLPIRPQLAKQLGAIS